MPFIAAHLNRWWQPGAAVQNAFCFMKILPEREEYDMAEKKTLMYRGKPLVRCGNDMYFGSMDDRYIVYMQILSTRKQGDEDVADKVRLSLMNTNTDLSPIERIVKISEKKGIWGALEIAEIWLERANKEGV